MTKPKSHAQSQIVPGKLRGSSSSTLIKRTYQWLREILVAVREIIKAPSLKGLIQKKLVLKIKMEPMRRRRNRAVQIFNARFAPGNSNTSFNYGLTRVKTTGISITTKGTSNQRRYLLKSPISRWRRPTDWRIRSLPKALKPVRCP